MKTKYILKDTEREKVIAIFHDRADAEEMYLTILEEDACEYCNLYLNYDSSDGVLEDYYQPFRNFESRKMWQTFEGMYLYMISGNCFPVYFIEEVPYFED